MARVLQAMLTGDLWYSLLNFLREYDGIRSVGDWLDVARDYAQDFSAFGFRALTDNGDFVVAAGNIGNGHNP